MAVPTVAVHEIQMLTDGAEASWTVHATAFAVVLIANAGEIGVRDSAGGTTFMLENAVLFDATNYLKAGTTWYFSGLRTARLGIIYAHFGQL